MKIYFRILPVILFIAASMLSMPGCEYDVMQSQWYEPPKETNIPVITSIDPDTGKAGVNIITIIGENFVELPDTNDVYFDIQPVDILDVSSTAITVRRPNIVADSCIIKVVPRKKALVVAKSKPYRIDPVLEKYGTFIENRFLSAVTVDGEENVYVTSIDSMYIFKVVPGAGKVVLTKAKQVPVDIKVTPDNSRLYMVGGGGGTGGNRNIYYCDIQTGFVDTLVQLASGKNVKFGEFADNGYFYVGGGNRIDIFAIAPDLTATATNTYTSNEVVTMKIYNNYLYVVSRTGSGTAAVFEFFKHAIRDNGALGAAEFILNWNSTPFGDRTIRAITFSAEGVLYVATDAENPIVFLDPDTNEWDYFYKDIVPSYIRDFNWGTGNYLYMVRGNTDEEQEWTTYRIDMGSAGIR
jgi:hypothetical protein